MASINYAAREISVKIVYYGPGLSGKTTNLQVIHRKVPPEFKSDMVSLATETDRTLFFDFLPLDLGKIKGFSTKFQLYTVPGQVYYNATRKLVLRGVDGVVFVADSGADKMQENFESFQNLEENLAEYGYKRETIPIIIQYNKRDLPNALPVDEIKIDRSFVMDMLADTNDAIIVNSIIALAHNMGLYVVAEGVENEAILVQLVNSRCDVIQGYHLAKPMPNHEFVEWLRTSHWRAVGKAV